MSSESTPLKVRTARTPGWWLDRVTYALLVFAGAASVLMALLVTYGVVRRYFFRSPDDNIYLIIYILMMCCALLSFAHTQRLGRHITVDFLSSRFSPLVRGIILNIVGPLMGLAFCACLVWMSWDNAMFAMSSGETTVLNTHVVVWPIKMLVPVGAVIMSLVFIAQILRFIFSLRGQTGKAK